MNRGGTEADASPVDKDIDPTLPKEREAADMDQVFLELLRNSRAVKTDLESKGNIWGLLTVIFGAAFAFSLAPGLGLLYFALFGPELEHNSPNR